MPSVSSCLSAILSICTLADLFFLPAGPQVFLERDGPRYFIAFATHLGCYALLVVDILLLRWYLTAQNKKRDRLAAEGVQEAHDEAFVHAFEDITDKKNPNFRYVY